MFYSPPQNITRRENTRFFFHTLRCFVFSTPFSEKFSQQQKKKKLKSAFNSDLPGDSLLWAELFFIVFFVIEIREREHPAPRLHSQPAYTSLISVRILPPEGDVKKYPQKKLCCQLYIMASDLRSVFVLCTKRHIYLKIYKCYLFVTQ